MPWCAIELNRSDSFQRQHFQNQTTAIILWIHIVSFLPAMQINLLCAVATSRIWFPTILLSISACPNDEQTIAYWINQHSAKPL